MLEYQDALWPGRTVAGERSSAERWDMLVPELPETGVLLDVGSNLGFYGISALRLHSGLALVSMEADPEIAIKQAQIAAANKLDRVVVLEGSLNAGLAERWAETCDSVDCCLLLSIVHWFDDPARVLAALSRMSRRLIVELPDVDDSGACGGDKRAQWGPRPEAWLASVTGRKVRLIGRPTRHTSDVNSWMFVIEGPTAREPRVPYLGSDYVHPKGRHYRLESDESGTRLWVRGDDRPWIQAVNLANLGVLGRLRYPRPAQLMREWNLAREQAPTHLDPAPHNVLWGPPGMVLIDGDDLDGHIANPSREMRKFFRAWQRGDTYDDRELRRAGDRREVAAVRQVWKSLPAPARRLLRPLLQSIRGRRPVDAA